MDWKTHRVPGKGDVMSISKLRLVAVFLGTAAIAWSADPVLGTWKLNASKSKYSPGPAPTEQTRVYEANPKGIKVTVKTIEADGQMSTVLITANYDGKDYPVVGSPDYDAIELKKIDEYTSESTLLHGPVVVATARREVSRDGKTMTITYKTPPYREHPINNLAVFDKAE
jgi:hypothetical protein